MKTFVKIAICIILVMGTLVGCTTKNVVEEEGTFSQDLINAKVEEIDIAQVSYSLADRKQFQDEEIIKELVDKLSGIKIKELTQEEEIALLKDNEVLYNVALFSNMKLVGSAIFFSTGEMVFTDTKTIDGGQKAVSYVNEENVAGKLQAIVSYLEDLRFK